MGIMDRDKRLSTFYKCQFVFFCSAAQQKVFALTEGDTSNKIEIHRGEFVVFENIKVYKSDKIDGSISVIFLFLFFVLKFYYEPIINPIISQSLFICIRSMCCPIIWLHWM